MSFTDRQQLRLSPRLKQQGLVAEARMTTTGD